MGGDLDARVRMLTFEFLERQTQVHGEVLPRSVLESGFELEGTRVPLLGPQGIFKPKVLPEVPISITTAPTIEGKRRPYDDELDYDGMIRYRATDPSHRDNGGLRLALKKQIPLSNFFGIVPGEYMPAWPVFIVGDDPASLTLVKRVKSVA